MSKEETWSIASATLEDWSVELVTWKGRAPRAPDRISRARHAGTSPGSRRSTGNRGDHKVAPTYNILTSARIHRYRFSRCPDPFRLAEVIDQTAPPVAYFCQILVSTVAFLFFAEILPSSNLIFP